MIENRIETLSGLYPMESRRMLKNYVSFLEDYPDWHERGHCYADYKRRSFVAELAPGENGMDRQRGERG